MGARIRAVSDTNCPKCDRPLAGGEAYCPRCGGSLKGLAVATQAGQPAGAVGSVDRIGPQAASAPAEEATAGEEILFGRFRVIEEMGAGGMGVVYRAEDLVERVEVAVKTLHSRVAGDREARERLRGVFGGWREQAPVETDKRIRERYDLIRIRPGTFLMGSPGDGQGPTNVEIQHGVRITRPFEVGRTPVTQALWTSLMGDNPSIFEGANRPVERVSWLDAVEFCNRLSERERIRPAYRVEGKDVAWSAGADGFRLPTEAEWEYAARAGERYRYAGSDDLGTVAVWNRYQSGKPAEQQRGTAPVGGKQPNAWGLCDMSGNVWEWCWDWFGRYPEGQDTDPAGPPTGSVRIGRGGSWRDTSQRYLRVADRNRKDPTGRYGFLGFRLARSLS